MNEPTRPVLRWHGGKWKLAPWIISHFPPHRVYVEPFGGAASVLLRKPRSYGEVYNDLDGDVVNLFQVLRSSASPHLVCELRLTPFSRAEFALAYEPSDDFVERARRLIIRSFMGMGSVSNAVGSKATGFRNNTTREGTLPAHDWAGYPDCLSQVIERLAGVIIEGRPALDVMTARDDDDVLHYLDPPYLPETRSQVGKRAGTGFVAYAAEMSALDHAHLIDASRSLAGMVVLSGYPSKLYDDALRDWRREETAAHADGARPRTEVLWINPHCAQKLDEAHAGRGTPLFGNEAMVPA